MLALQGAVSEHIDAFRLALDTIDPSGHSSVISVRHADEIPGLDGLAIPGGESTTISRLIDKNQMRRPIEEFEGGIFATCAGMVLMATEVGDSRIRTLGLIEMNVERNAFGRQRESFETDLEIVGFDTPVPCDFYQGTHGHELRTRSRDNFKNWKRDRGCSQRSPLCPGISPGTQYRPQDPYPVRSGTGCLILINTHIVSLSTRKKF